MLIHNVTPGQKSSCFTIQTLVEKQKNHKQNNYKSINRIKETKQHSVRIEYRVVSGRHRKDLIILINLLIINALQMAR